MNQRILGIGSEMYFDHHPREKWSWYADRMAELGLSFARIGEFSWNIFETDEGKFQLEWLDEVIGLLVERDISVLLCTPTGSPPDWLCAKYPEIVPTTIQGRSYGTSSRRHTCPTSPAYRESCRRIVEAMGRRYARHPRVIGWQIDNEIGHPFCYCQLCHAAFQQWVRTQFATIDDFNSKVGQFFLGRTSRSFDEVPLPGASGDSGEPGCNPGLTHLYYRFMDHQIRECWGLQADWLRACGVTVPITTNVMNTWYGYDHEKLFAKLDVVAGDCYPSSAATKWDLYRDGRLPGFAFHTAYLRGIKHGSNIGFCEMRWSPTSGDPQYPMPGEIKYWAYACFAGGADFINYFRFDTCPSGGERGHYGLIPSSGVIPRTFAEVKDFCAEVKRLVPMLSETTVPTAPVGILYSHATHLATHIRPELDELGGPFGNGFTMHLARHLRAIVDHNIPTDIVYPGEDVGKYRVLVATALQVIDKPLAQKLEAFVAGGGTLIVFPFTGFLDENSKEWEIPHPAHLDHVLGVSVESNGLPRLRKLTLSIEPTPKSKLPRLTVSSLVNFLQLDPSVEVLAKFRGAPLYNGQPAITCRRHGKGMAYYVAAFLDEAMLAKLYPRLLAGHDIEPEFMVPRGVHYAKRTGPRGGLYFVSNSTDKTAQVKLPFPATDFFSGKRLARFTLPPAGVRVCVRVKGR